MTLMSQKKTKLNVAERQSCIRSWFTQSKKIMQVVKELEVSNFTIYLNINFIEILDKYPKLTRSSLSLNFLKSWL